MQPIQDWEPLQAKQVGPNMGAIKPWNQSEHLGSIAPASARSIGDPEVGAWPMMSTPGPEAAAKFHAAEVAAKARWRGKKKAGREESLASREKPGLGANMGGSR